MPALRQIAALVLLLTVPVSTSHAFSFKRGARETEQTIEHADRSTQRKNMLGKLKGLLGKKRGQGKSVADKQQNEMRIDDNDAILASRHLLEIKARSQGKTQTKKQRKAEKRQQVVVEATPLSEPHAAVSVVADEKLSYGDRLADKVTAMAGSWKFINMFTIAVVTWIVGNTFAAHPIDPAPFIGLNLLMSAMATYQAPFILMSANRQAKKDAQRAEADYKINIESEKEVRSLHDKVDAQAAKIDDLTQMLAQVLDKLNTASPQQTN